MKTDALTAAVLILLIGILASVFDVPNVFISSSEPKTTLQQEFAVLELAASKQRDVYQK